MTLLQNAAIRKTLGVVKGTSGRKANTVAAVEDVETFAKAVTGRFLACTLWAPRGLLSVWWTRDSLNGASCPLGMTVGGGMWMW